MIQESQLSDFKTWLTSQEIPFDDHPRFPVVGGAEVALEVRLGRQWIPIYRRAPGASWLVIPAELVELVGRWVSEGRTR